MPPICRSFLRIIAWFDSAGLFSIEDLSPEAVR